MSSLVLQDARLLHLGGRGQRLEDPFGIGHGPLDDAKQAPEGRVGSVAQALVHPALTRSDDDTRLGSQAVQRDDHLAPVAAADGVGEHIGHVPGVAQVEGRLGDADVRLDADEGDARARGQGGGELGHEHGELCLVEGRGGEEGGEGGDGRAQLGDGLGGGVDGDGQGRGEGEELGRGGDAVGTAGVSRGWRCLASWC